MSNQPQLSASNSAVNAERTYADLILDYLLQIDVDYIFGIPGGALEPLYNALDRQQKHGPTKSHTNPLADKHARKSRRNTEAIRAITARHEAGAVFMAEGYSRETGKLGVCCATTGPGATNLLTGVASAYQERIPMLVITPQTALPNFGRHALQESSEDAIDTVGIFEHCTRYNSLVSHADQLEGKLFTSLFTAFQHPRGPVHLSIPMDILNGRLLTSQPRYQVATMLRQPSVMDEAMFGELCQSIKTARKKLLFIGGGCKSAIRHIVQFAEMLEIPIVTSAVGKACISSYHSLNRGVFGFAGHASAGALITGAETDLIIAVGTSLDELSTGGWDSALLNDKLVHIDATAENFSRSPMAKLHVLGELRYVFSSLISEFSLVEAASKQRPKIASNVINQSVDSVTSATFTPDMQNLQGINLDSGEAWLSAEAPIKPQRLMHDLTMRLPANSRFVADAGNAWAWTTHYLHLKQGNRYRIGMGFGAMAWAIGAAVGTALGCRGTAVVCITGDGSFLMSGQEITVAVAEKLPVIYVVLNDRALGMVKHGQMLRGGAQIAFELPPVDFVGMAKSLGADAHAIYSPQDLERLDFDAMCTAKRPTLLDVHIDVDEVPPIGARINTLKKGDDAKRGAAQELSH
ncbi:MAG: thiamine pyrophosphate-binding protein [Pseudomonadales bacterium]